MSNIIIDIAAQFTGKGAFKQADSAAAKLNSSVKKLAGTFGLAFGTQAVVQFGKQSVRAFMDAERESAVLVNTVKNLGLAFEQPAIDNYISEIGRLYGVTGDKAVPAMQALLSATGSAAKSQEIMNTALDVSSSLGLDVSDVAVGLSQAYLGNTKALKKYNLGLTQAELAASDFDAIQTKLNKNFAGAATSAAATYSGQLLILTEAGNQAQEIIGKGIIDSLMVLAGDTTVQELADTMLEAAENTAEFSKNIAAVIRAINTPLNFAAKGLAWFVEKTQPLADLLIEGDPSGFMKKTSTAVSSMSAPSAGFNGSTFYADAQKIADARAKAEKDAIARAKALAKLIKDQAANQAKILKDKKLAAAIDKANVALGKSDNVFDIEKIQIAAALANQAKLLGEATSTAQQMQVATDIARLNVKRSILALEDAIASKDEASIISATKKLETDLKVLNALTGQNTQMTALETILKGLKPADLINQSNLDKALATIQEMLRLLAQANTAANAKVPNSGSLGSGIPAGDYIAPVSKDVAAKASIDAILEYADAAAARANAFADLLDMDTAAKTAALQTSSLYDNSGALQSFRQKESASINVVNNFNGIMGDPNAAAELMDQVITDAVQRGTLRGYAIA
jgi:hypothetical protein